jgi:hypothetical protein
MKIMDLSQIVAKWVKRAAASTSDYISGVANPKRPWQEATVAAVSAYEEGIAQAIQNNLFTKGVRRVSNSDWADRATRVGAPRFASGVRESESKYNAGFAPYHAVLSALTLPPRGPRNSPQNYQRVQAIGEALAKARIGQ